MCQQLSHVRLRCGLVDLGHLAGRQCWARAQQCIGCNVLFTHMWAHVFGECPCWNAERDTVFAGLTSSQHAIRSWDIMFLILAATPADRHYAQCLHFIDAVVSSAISFWRQDPQKQRQSFAVLLACMFDIYIYGHRRRGQASQLPPSVL